MLNSQIDLRFYPQLNVFERLYIHDGLLINAERWQQSHRYHRQHQNFQYQCLYQPGIVYGLGVTIVPNQPNGRLLRVKAGVAIDIEGNPIVVQEAMDFWLQSTPKVGETLLVYLVANYVDPDQRRNVTKAERVQESFELIEKTQLAPQDVEICRIHLTEGNAKIQIPQNVFTPTSNSLDLRHRVYPIVHSEFHVQVGQVINNQPNDEIALNNWMDLLSSLPALYPRLSGDPTVMSYTTNTLARAGVLNCQLLHLSYQTMLNLSEDALHCLKTYMAEGGTILVTIDFSQANLLEMLNLRRELCLGYAQTEEDRSFDAKTREALKAAVSDYDSDIDDRLQEIEAPLRNKFTIDPSYGGELAYDHPLRRRPFLFSQFPCQQKHPVYVKNWGGLVYMVGDLSLVWGLHGDFDCSREILRSAQEFGINLLHFAAQRWQWTQATQIDQPTESVDSLSRRTNS
jgi:hypothetical protein